MCASTRASTLSSRRHRFRLWLAALDTDADRDAKTEELEAELRRIALSYGKELAGQIGAQAVFRGGEMSVPEDVNIFEGSVRKLFPAVSRNQLEVI